MSKVKDFYPLSPMQEGMLFHSLMDTGSGVYVKQGTYALSGDLNIPALERAWQDLVEQYAILRTFFVWEDLKKPIQLVHASVNVTLHQERWSNLTEAELQQRLEEYLHADRIRGFDLAQPPLMRMALISLDDDNYRLIWTWHHILIDGWSEGLLDKAIFEIYSARCAGRKPQLSRSRPFRDYIRWLQQQELPKAETFWRRTLKGFTSPSTLGRALTPEEQSQPSPPYGRKRVAVSEETTTALNAFARKHSLTLSNLLKGAWSLILAGYCGRQDVVFGSVVSGRPADLDGVENIVGLFVNTLPVRIRITPETQLLPWLKEIQAQQAETLQYEYSPLLQIQKWSDTPRGVPLFESIVAFDMSSLAPAESARTHGNIHIKIDGGSGNLQISNPLSILVHTGPQLSIGMSYDCRLFDDAFIDQLLDDFKRLIESFVAYPARSLTYFATRVGPDRSHVAEFPDELAELCDRSNLTRNQLIVWLGQKLNAEVPLYNIPYIIKLSGHVEPDHIRNAWRSIVNSSDALRTIFEEDETGGIRQRVLPAVEWDMEQLDFSREPNPAIKLNGWLRERSKITLPMNERLLDSALIKMSDTEFAAYFNTHQLITDAWSDAVIIRQLLSRYERSLTGQLSDSQDLGQFWTYVEHERNLRNSAQYKEAEEFWRQELADDVEPLAFYGRVPVKHNAAVDKVSVNLGPERTQRLKEIAAADGIFLLSQELTLFTVFVSLASSFLYRITGTPRIPLGIYYHNRTGFRDTIGLFMHVHPLRVTVENTDTFRSLVRLTQSEYRRISKYRHYPIANPARKPAYDVLVNYVNMSLPTRINGTRVGYEWLHPGHGAESLNIELHDFEASGSFEVGFRFHRDVFSDQQRVAAIRHFLQILDSFLTDPDQPVAHATLLTRQEREQLLVKFNQTQREYDQGETVVTQFARQAAETPARIAVEVDGSALTYEQLNTRANQLAHALRRRGVTAETVVALCTERSLELIVGMLGVLKAGAAFVPLDPAYPQERLAFMLKDSRARVLLTQHTQLSRLPQQYLAAICLDSGWDAIAAESSQNPDVGPTTDNLAYVIYTSGSTGVPKGTMIQHGSLFDYTQTAAREYGITAADRVLQFCSVSFDISIEEIIPCLTQGATLVLRNDEMLASVPTFLTRCNERDITVMSLPTAYWHEITEVVDSSALSLPSSLRLIIIAGERVLPERLSAWQRRTNGRPSLINTYGLTESTIISTAVELSTVVVDGGEVPVGGPVSNTQLYVLDKNSEPVPVGMPGELHIGGRLLARGYYRQPELTAERFRPSPFADQPGARVYRTGDLAKFSTAEALEFLGRRDRQVKIRGFRVELEEVAATLQQHPAVRDCAVIVREDTPGQKQLVAYVVPRQQPAPPSNYLREFLGRNLPDYMVPAIFIALESLPLTPNGKLDYAALPSPSRSGAALDNIYAGPLTRIERELGDIWAAVLGVDRVGIHDNYFELGGDSIRSIQIRAKAQRRGIEFTVQDLFQQQTIQALAKLCEVRGPGSAAAAETAPFSLISDADRERLPRGVEDAFPLARLQAGMVFHNLYHVNSDLYIDVSTIYLQLPYDLNALERSIGQLIARHPILRTTFDLSTFSEPLQLVWPTAPCRLEVEDLRGLSNEEQDEIVLKWLDEETRRQFDLSDVPLIRFHVHRRSDTALQFSWANHHAILDGWSMAIMLTELFQLYTANQSGKQSNIGSPPAISYREFVALEREVLNSKDAQQYLSDRVRGLTVTTMPRRPQSNGRRGIPEVLTEAVVPPPELCDKLRQLASSVNIPLKSFVLAAQLKVLSMVSGQSDVTTGMVVSGRPEREDGDRVLGLFTNTVPVRMNLTGGTWMELVKGVFDVEGELLPFRRFPISELKTLEGGQILFETMFNFTHFYLYKTVPRVSGAEVFDVKIRGASNYVFVTDCNQDFSSSQFELALSYDASLVDREQVRAVRRHFLKTLESMVKDPYSRYELMSPLSDDERKQLLIEWNNTAVRYPNEKPVHELFEEQATRAGDSLAVVYEDRQVTYAELNGRANQLAHYLRRLGVGPEVLVGVTAERSIELVVALLGILKAGGAYVPIDPSYPKHRVEYMLADSEVSIVLTQSHVLGQLPQSAATLISLDDGWADIAVESSENPASVAGGSNSIYMIYTSGSTGRPKGAVNTHSGLFNRLTWMQQQYGLTPDDRVLQKTPFSFDVSVWEFFWPLIAGARLVFAKPGGHQDPAYLIELINRAQITTLHFVPSMLQAFVDHPEVQSCRSLRQVMSSGEALSYELQQRFFERLDVRLHNLYGPTEAAIDVTFWECEENDERSVPIGRPISNTEIYLLDPGLQPVPVGAPGELYIGGVGLARGYHSRAALTAQQFVPNPFSQMPSRLYKTGDLARYRSDGAIDYLGRSDHQVKIRGFRIEPGEIEAALLAFSNVKELLVQAQNDARGEVMLIAYIVYDHEPAPKPAEVREFLRQRLPEYMVPAAFVLMASFPLTANGKINRRALAAMRPEKLESERRFVPPRNPVELRLVSVWEQVFNLHPIGVEDNFFDLGGHSILALRLMAQVQKEFGQALPLSTLTEAGDIAHLAEVLNRHGVADSKSPIVPIQPKGSKPPIFCVHPLGGHVLRFYDLARKLGPDQPFYGIQGRDVADVGDDYESIEEMAEAYVSALRKTQPVGPYHVGGYSFGSFVAFEMAQQLVSAGEEVALLFLLDTWAPHILQLLPDFEKDALLLSVIANEIAMRSGNTDFEISASELEQLDGDAQMIYVLDQMKKAGVVPQDLSSDIALSYGRQLMKGIRTRGAAWRNYRPEVYPGRITFLRCVEQEPFLYNSLADAGGDVEDPTAGWRALTTEPIDIHFVPGYHERMMNEPTVSEVAKVLAQCADGVLEPAVVGGVLV